MSERAFFSLRHSIPGFTFIVLIVSTNLVPIFEKLSGAEVGSEIFIGFLSLLSGPTFGFLISQIWWFAFHRLDADWRLAPDAFTVFLTRFNKKKPESRQQKAKLIPVLDYIYHYEGYVKKDVEGHERKHSVSKEGIFRYIERRWDLFHILGSEFVALWAGFPIGIYLRLALFKYPLVNNDAAFFVILPFALVILSLLLWHGILTVRSEHNALSAAIVKSTWLKWKELANLFPVLNDLETVNDQA